jgi:hypothetical protein
VPEDLVPLLRPVPESSSNDRAHWQPPKVIEIRHDTAASIIPWDSHTTRATAPPKPRRTVPLHMGSTSNGVVVPHPSRPSAPDDAAPGSRIRVVLGPTGQSFLLLLQEDNGQHTWQNRYWRNLPHGLDQQLRTVDRVHQCAFTDSQWFLMARSKVTGLTHTWWCVESLDLHEAIEAAIASDVLVRIVFGQDAGQYVVLLGVNGYTVGASNIPLSLLEALQGISAKQTAVSRIRGLNASGRFLLEESIVQDPTDESSAVRSVFHSYDLSTYLLDQLNTSTPCDLVDIAMGVTDKAWLVLRRETYEGSMGVHDELISRLDVCYARFRQRRVQATGPLPAAPKSSTMKSLEQPAVTTVLNEQQRTAISAESEIKVARDSEADNNSIPQTMEPDKTVESRTTESKEDTLPKRMPQTAAPTESMDHAIVRFKWQRYQAAAGGTAVQKRDKEDRLAELQRKAVYVGDRVTVCGHSTETGDAFVLDIEAAQGFVVVNLPHQGSPDDIVGIRSGTAATIKDPRLLIRYGRDDGLQDDHEAFLLPTAQDKYEAALMLFHSNCDIGTCACKHDFAGYSQQLQQPNQWKVGDRINVIGYANGSVIEPADNYAHRPNVVHVLYDDGTSYHVAYDLVRPEKRFVGSIQCPFQISVRPEEESALRIRPLLENNQETVVVAPFDEHQCAEKIDLRRLQKLCANLRSDSLARRTYMDELAVQLEQDPDNWTADYCYRKLVHCYDLEETALLLYEVLKQVPMDPTGCVVHQVQYRSKDPSGRGRLFAIGRPVRVLGWKFPRTLTLQGIQPEWHAPLTGAFGHYVDCENSDVRLVCSLAQQIGCADIIPTFKDYRQYRSKILQAMHCDHREITLAELSRLPSYIVWGGSYDSWLRAMEETKVSPHVKQFGFCMYNEVRALRDQLLVHPRFQWTIAERDRLEKQGLRDDAVKVALFATILQASEIEVQRIIHRTFHNRGWTVRAKLLDSIIVEQGPKGRAENNTLLDLLRLTERTCEAQGWDVRLVEKCLHGRQDEPVPAVVEARAVLRERPTREATSPCVENPSGDEAR